MPDGSTPGVRRGRKFEQVLEGAREVFMTDGFEGASVDDIARAAGVSKATLYSYFPDKQLLFLEVAKSECARQAALAQKSIENDAPVREVLTRVAGRLMDFMTSDFGRRMFRICAGESERFPTIGREFYESGPCLVRARMIEYLGAARDRGELRIDDMDLAADQFPALCKAGVFDRLVFGVTEVPTPQDRARTIEGAVDTFLARYGTADQP